MSRWSSFPRRRVFERLSQFPAGPNSGANMAALRVYLALALRANFSDRRASASLTDLQSLTGLSRPMVTKGIRTAVSASLIAVESSGYRHTYHLQSDEKELAFAKIPTARLRAALPQLPTRGFHALDALKVYLALVLVRPRESFLVPIGVRNLALRSHVQPRRVRAAIDVLINHRLLRIVEGDSNTGGHPHHAYRLLGFDAADVLTVESPSPTESGHVDLS